MNCPFCDHETTEVKDSRMTVGNAIRRRRKCQACAAKFTTFERVSSHLSRGGRRAADVPAYVLRILKVAVKALERAQARTDEEEQEHG